MKKNFQYYLFVLGAALLPISCFALHADKETNDTHAFSLSKEKALKDGFYIGIQAGYDSYQVKDKVIVGDDDVDIFQMNPSLGATGWLGGFFAGFGHDFPHHLYLGTEAFLNSTQANTDYTYQSLSNSAEDSDIFNSKFQVNNSYGIALLPGVKLTPTFLLYAHLGWSWINIKTQQSLTSDVNGNGFNNEIVMTSNQSKRIGGFSYGIGMESFIVDNFSLRGEYIHTNYSSFSNYTFFTTPLGANFSTSNNEFVLGLVYHLT